jgi:NAD(P)-dependent dehydrogenase (short-subunit alcohol dehydrogenase family)
VITGASSGIGYALSGELTGEGAKVYCLSRTKPVDPVKGVLYLQADLTQEEDVRAAIEQIMEPVDLLVNNAGMMKRGHYYEISADEFDKVWSIDVKGSWLMFKYLRDKLVKGAMTLQINSKNSLILKADTFAYTLSKLADLQIDALVAKDRTDLDMRVAHFGPVNTLLEWTDYTDLQKAEKMKVALTPDQAGKLVFDLIRSDKKRLVYKDEENIYLME